MIIFMDTCKIKYKWDSKTSKIPVITATINLLWITHTIQAHIKIQVVRFFVRYNKQRIERRRYQAGSNHIYPIFQSLLDVLRCIATDHVKIYISNVIFDRVNRIIGIVPRSKKTLFLSGYV